jgi:predicted nucleic acid-binding protein
MCWLLDSDVLSQPAKKAGDVRVITWIEKHQQQCYTSSIVIAQLVLSSSQLALWVRTKRGKQRAAMHMWLTQLVEAMHGRILGFNVSVARVWADLHYQLQKAAFEKLMRD